MSTPVRFPGGINTSKLTSGTGAMKNNHPFVNLPYPDPFRVFHNDDDFESYRTVDWTLTLVGAGTSAAVAGAGGLIQLTTGAVLNDSVNLQHATASYLGAVGQQGWYSTRIIPQLASVPEYYFGMVNGGTTAVAGLTDGFYFHCAAASANVDFVMMKATVATTIASIGVLADATASVWSMYYDGKSTLGYYKDNVLLGTATLNAASMPTVNLAPWFYNKNGAAATNYLQVDYLMSAVEMSR